MKNKPSTSTITKENIQVAVGQIWKDQDWRQPNRRCKVFGIEVGEKHAVAFMQNLGTPNAKATRVKISRMRKGSTGWALES